MDSRFFTTIGLLAFSLAAEAQICNPAVARDAPDSRYAVQGDGSEVLDKQTGLVWQRCRLGQSWSGVTCSGSGQSYSTWQSALQAAVNFGGGWRVPNIRELESLVENACTAPAINETLFPGSAYNQIFWTSSPYVSNGANAWGVDFTDGNARNFGKSTSSYFNVRLVRANP